MAHRSPSVFVSSTCFDLAQLREDLRDFLISYGLDPVLSEFSSFPVDPQLEPIENCINVVRERADVLLLIVGGRYGSIAPSTGRSITNLEYLEAKQKGIPVYVFVKRDVLSVLPVWAASPSADFSRVCDSTELFRFVSTLRDDSRWVFGFESVKDIVEILRSQFSYLFAEGLKLRQQARESLPTKRLRELTGRPLRIALERPAAWEYLLFSALLEAGMSESADVKRDLQYFVHSEPIEHVLEDDVLRWMQARLADAVEITDSLDQLVNVALPDAFGPPGIEGDPDKIAYVADRIIRGYRRSLEFSAAVQRVSVDERFERARDLLSRFVEAFPAEIERVSRQFALELGEALSKPDERSAIEITMTFRITDGLQGDFEAALQSVITGSRS